jgi:hypothetical protein
VFESAARGRAAWFSDKVSIGSSATEVSWQYAVADYSVHMTLMGKAGAVLAGVNEIATRSVAQSDIEDATD